MAKISVSISDELKARLDQRAAADDLPVSHVVSNALIQYLDGAPQPAPEIIPPAPAPPDSHELDQIREYLWQLSWNYERSRQVVGSLFHWGSTCGVVLGYPPPPAMPNPPWPRKTRETEG